MCMGLPMEIIFCAFMAVLRAAGASCPVDLGSEHLLPGLVACPTPFLSSLLWYLLSC